MFNICPFFSLVGNVIMARAAVKASSWNGFGCARICAAIASACERVDCTVRWHGPWCGWFAPVRGKGHIRGLQAQLHTMPQVFVAGFVAFDELNLKHSNF